MKARRGSPMSWLGNGWFLGALLVVATLTAYLPVWRAGFIWDDDTFLWRNPLILQPDGLARFWFSTAAPDYFPMVSTTLWLEWRLWGANPLGYHLVNVLLHALSSVLLWGLLKRLKTPGAWLAAAIFAVHPVNVESVAWITERKNTLAMFFYLASLLCYVRLDEDPQASTGGRQGRWYGLSLVLFALALLSKTAVAPLPLVLLGLAWWRRGRVGLRDAWRSAPFFGLALAMGLVTLWFQYHRAIGASLLDVRSDSFWSRLAGAGWAVWFYLYKALLPLSLSFVYPRWEIDATQTWAYLPGFLWAALLIGCWCFRRRWGKAMLLSLGYFSVMLLPVLGFVNIYFMRYSLVADHWQYFAILGPIALCAAVITRAAVRVDGMLAGWLSGKAESLARGLASRCAIAQVTVCSALLLILGVLTWRQAGTYRNLETLWTATLARNPGSSLAHNNLGNLLLERGQVSEALGHFQQALATQPKAADIHSNLGGALLRLGRVEDAIVSFETALKLQPDSAQAHNNLGSALSKLGRWEEAMACFRKAAELHPSLAGTCYNLGSALLQAGRPDEAIVSLQRALELQPDLAEARLNLANALLAKGRLDDAIAQLQKALEAQPQLASAYHNLGNALLQKGQVDDAVTQFRKALAIQADFAAAHNGLGNALLRKGELDEAIRHFQQALQIAPSFAEAHLNLAEALVQNKQLDRAIAHFRKALELNPGVAAAHNNLANALLEQGAVDEAIAHFQAALKLQPDLAQAHNGLGNALLQKGQAKKAVAHYEAAIAALPNHPYLLNNLAWVLATNPDASVRNGVRAVELAQQAERLSGGKDPAPLGTLAAAYAEAGRFAEAVATAQRGLALAAAQGNTALAETFRRRLALFQAGSALRDPALSPRAQ